MGRGLTPLQFWRSGGVTPGKFFENIGAIWAFWGHKVIKVGLKKRCFSVPLLIYRPCRIVLWPLEGCLGFLISLNKPFFMIFAVFSLSVTASCG